MIKVLFICKGNICRSPTAEGIFRNRVEQAGLSTRIKIDSAGTHDCHTGKQPDTRAQAAAKRRGIDLSDLRARPLQPEDFQTFDYILAMDRKNISRINLVYPEQKTEKVRLFLDYAKTVTDKNVPDPYYGSDNDFEHMIDIIDKYADNLLEHIIKEHELHSCIAKVA